MVEVVSVREHDRWRGVYVVELEDGSLRIATKNLVPGQRVYGERIFRYNGEEYREWNAYRSKLAAALLKGLIELPVKEGDRILYLGIASGTTASHMSDIIGPRGRIYGVEFAPRVMRDLLTVVRDRRNIFPILGDARFPEKYRHLVEGVDGLYADVAQPEQAAIVVRNARFFLRDGGYMLMAIKARSIDVTTEPSEVYKREIKTLMDGGLEIKDVVHLDPFDRDHAMIYAVMRR
ncbi:snoRNA binding protein [Aeropyrum pernix K1]|uniref:Fibrillarin-like rRNA/tRNA 2'-O-methyltransferase n=1 Tax=Aeropyrum pernix (strain ATCC 700893 / DSM 11879 / JCM 9820 / NBRC 100138 / K1) TaxID=272557 RepID=FLPA_AERPE|nr:fibrillarin-like rRNA/tRNA 2'-O-methyltransferase [Aeropyrum pernix]Q9Y9U3.1 RecName: Full=Fibrillarin-like rRNA/tRNA 2'-O-methyltransferase [Aeropyrum pernix K1]BAA81207.1 snoRNA binding protein [Aeropyrum pernix K1]